ncbi:RNA polymerase sigma factor [Jongsikchunia kroppenstedtii]|uniref:RNA polymerase sigma factor n=1 Tax=Jongsikchunia kroppenstedtii TaxID=1121721 RepID=UPI0003720E80|nr:DUF6596 domain-containing protein [Jongsikchunia kroppenstedtii]
MAVAADQAASAVARTSYGRLLSLLAAASNDIAAAEDSLADAFERALRRWPVDGVPDSPDAWLLTVARNRQRDRWRAASSRDVELDNDIHGGSHLDDIDPDAIGDRRLELLLVCAHPAISPAAHTPLMLNTVLGFTATQIGTAFAVPPTTMAARLTRAKKRIKAAHIPFRIPDREALPGRMQAVTEAIYGAYAIDWNVGELGAEALQLAELLAELAPDGDNADRAEAHGLAALISLSSARLAARDPQRYVPLTQQDPQAWDADLIENGRRHLAAAHRLGMVGRFQLEAAISAVHCARRDTGVTDWTTLRSLYTTLREVAPTLGGQVALAAVVAEIDGPEAGVAILDRIGESARRFQPWWAARALLLARAGSDATAAYDKAISLTTDPAERRYLAEQRARV